MKMGLKIGVGFQKDSYFDFKLLRNMTEKKIGELVDSLGSVPDSYQSNDIKKLFESGQDNGVWSGVDLVAGILRIYRNYGFKTEVIAASIRNPRQAREVAELGVHIATLPFEVIEGMVTHHKTMEGMRDFTADIVPLYRDLFKQD
jgi:hypothetical protein